MTTAAPIKIRLSSYKSFRHYGGREIKETVHVCNATLISEQTGHQRYVVTLNEDCAGYKKGHKIAVSENDFNIQ